MAEKKLVVNVAWCTGCGICAEFCPKEALAMEHGKVIILDKAKCICCGLCEQRCPDYAIYVDSGEEVVKS